MCIEFLVSFLSPLPNVSTNFFTNTEINSKRRKHRKIGESTNGHKHTSTNRDENKSRVKDTNEEKDKEIAAKGEKVDEKIQKNSHLIFDRDETLQNDFWIGKTFVDITREI